MPIRIQRKRVRGWRMPEGAVYVGRPSRWGNPFRANSTTFTPRYLDPGWVELDVNPGMIVYPFSEPEWRDEHPIHVMAVPDAATAVHFYRCTRTGTFKAMARKELAGKDLACWCPLDAPCHADVLLELANAPA